MSLDKISKVYHSNKILPKQTNHTVNKSMIPLNKKESTPSLEELINRQIEIEEKLDSISNKISKLEKKKQILLRNFNTHTLCSLQDITTSINNKIIQPIYAFFGVELSGDVFLSNYLGNLNSFENQFDLSTKTNIDLKEIFEMIQKRKEEINNILFPFDVLYELIESVYYIDKYIKEKGTLLQEMENISKEKEKEIMKQNISQFHIQSNSNLKPKTIESQPKENPKKNLSLKKLKLNKMHQSISYTVLTKKHSSKNKDINDKQKEKNKSKYIQKLENKKVNIKTQKKNKGITMNKISKYDDTLKNISRISALTTKVNSKEISVINTETFPTSSIKSMNNSIIIQRKASNIIMTEGNDIPKETITENRNDFLNEINDSPFHIPNIKGTVDYLPKQNYERIIPRLNNVITQGNGLEIDRIKYSKNQGCCVTCT